MHDCAAQHRAWHPCGTDHQRPQTFTTLESSGADVTLCVLFFCALLFHGILFLCLALTPPIGTARGEESLLFPYLIGTILLYQEGTTSCDFPMAANDSPHTLEWEVVRAANGELYRRSIQAYVMNEKGFFLAFQPCGNSNGNFRQPIQGGIDRGETPLDALTREMKEEAGLVLGRDVHVIAEVLPLSAALVSSATAEDEEGGDSQGDTAGNATHAVTERHNSKDEVLDETRATYRYKSKTWRKAGVSGQELYPFLLYANESVIRRVNLKPASKDVRREFSRVFWEPLSSFAEHVAPAKRDPMLHIVPAVYHAAMQYRKEQGQPRLLPDADVITTTAYFQSRLTENHLALDGETGLLTKAQL